MHFCEYEDENGKLGGDEYDYDGYKRENELYSDAKEIDFDQIPEILKDFLKDLKNDNYIKCADVLIKDSLTIYFNTYKVSQFYCIPE